MLNLPFGFLLYRPRTTNPSSNGDSFRTPEDIITACLACGLFRCWWHPAAHRAQEKPGKGSMGGERRAVRLCREHPFLIQHDLPGHVPRTGTSEPHSYESWSFWGHWLHIWGEGPKSAPKGRNEDQGQFQGRNSKVWGWDRGPTSLGLEDTLPVYNEITKYKSSHGVTPPWFPDALSFDPHSGPVFHQLFVPSMQFPVPCLCIAAITSEFPSPRKPFSFFFWWVLFILQDPAYLLPPSSNLLEPSLLPSSLPIRTSILSFIQPVRTF